MCLQSLPGFQAVIYIYIYVYIHVYVYVYIYVCVNIHVRIQGLRNSKSRQVGFSEEIRR